MRIRLLQARWQLTATVRSTRFGEKAVARVRTAIGRSRDAIESARGHERPWYVPPRADHFVGGGDFLGVGRNVADLLSAFAGLEADSDVLDIGCGIGRVAVALRDRLGPDASYQGIDVDPRGIDWCRAEITSRDPRFEFGHLDAKSDRYNPGGSLASSSVRLPYEDDSFDVAFASSVFTHMHGPDIENYLAEARRVLRPGGRLLATWYLLDPTRPRARGKAGSVEHWFPDELEPGVRAVSARMPEFAIAFDRRFAESAHERAGLEGLAVHYGSWLGDEGPSFQDTTVASVPG